jgi:hypothetical protein
MGCLWLVLAILMPLLIGCKPPSEPQGPTAVSSSHAKSLRPVAAEKPAAQAAAKAVVKQPPRLRDDFNLPLVIKMEVPAAPPELQKPSPPIQKPSKSP